MTMDLWYDDDALTIMEKVNEQLKEHGLEFECDNLPHDGWERYILVKKEIENGRC